jgi:predicted phosphodiesterase
MIILHVTDFHFNKRWFDWLLHSAPAHDLVVMSGDMLDLGSATPQRRQIEWVSDWLNDFPRPISVCSGNHDLEWDPECERWMPAYWLRDIVNRHVWIDSQRVDLNGTSLFNIGCTTRPKGGTADIWVVHAGPTKKLITAHASGGDGGDPDLNPAVSRYAPRLVLSGHVHDPLHWRQQDDTTLFLNPGSAPHAEIPNHILVRTDDLSCRFFGILRNESHDQVEVFGRSRDETETIAVTAVA